MTLNQLAEAERGWILIVLAEISEADSDSPRALASLWTSLTALEGTAYTASCSPAELVLRVPGEKPLTLMRGDRLRAVCNAKGSYQRKRLERCLHLIFTPRRGR